MITLTTKVGKRMDELGTKSVPSDTMKVWAFELGKSYQSIRNEIYKNGGNIIRQSAVTRLDEMVAKGEVTVRLRGEAHRRLARKLGVTSDTLRNMYCYTYPLLPFADKSKLSEGDRELEADIEMQTRLVDEQNMASERLREESNKQ